MKPQLLSEKQAQRPRGTLMDELKYFLNISGGRAKNTEIFQWLILGRPDVTDKDGWKQVVSNTLKQIATATDKSYANMGKGGGLVCTWVLKDRFPTPREITEAPPQEPITINAPAFNLETHPVKVHRRPRLVSRTPIELPKMIDITEIPGFETKAGGIATWIPRLPAGKAFVLTGKDASTASRTYYKLKKQGKIPSNIFLTVKNQADKARFTAYLMNKKGD